MEEIDTIKANEILRIENGKFYKIVSATEKDFLCLEIRENATIELLSHLEPIVKHSPNIIDLIEVGDYVNGYRVVDIMEDMKTGELHLEMTSDYTNKELGDCTIYNKDIKSVVTREQFNQVKYEV